jgi:hypothetical protein
MDSHCERRRCSPLLRNQHCQYDGFTDISLLLSGIHWYRLDLTLDARLEYLTLAVGNAKSHPISIGSRHETAIAFLTDLEEKLDVAQVQLELYNVLLPYADDGGVTGEKIKLLSKRLFTMSEVPWFAKNFVANVDNL